MAHCGYHAHQSQAEANACEVERLRAEIERLRAENERLRKLIDAQPSIRIDGVNEQLTK